MSFFAKGKRRHNQINSTPNKQVHGKKPIKKPDEVELTSSESEYDEGPSEAESSQDEQETAQEKRLRLAKIYLQEIEKEEKERLNDADVDDTAISKRLKEDYLKDSGKFKSFVADEYISADENNITILRAKEHRSSITCLCISSDDKFIFSGSKDGSIVKWLLTEKRKVASLPFRKKSSEATSKKPIGHNSSINCIAVSDNFKFLAIGDESNEIQIWDPNNFHHIKTFKSHRNSITGLVFRRGANQLYSCSKDRSVKNWDMEELSYLETLFGHQDSVLAIDALSRERAVTAGGTDKSLRIWKIPEESQLLFNGNGSIDCVKLISEDNFISGSDTGEVCVWSALHKKPLYSIKAAHGCDPINNQPLWINCVATLVNTDLLATGSNDGFIRLWKVGKAYRTISALFQIPVPGFINSLQFTSDGKSIIAGVGQEHRFGRWTVIKEAKNSVLIIPLLIKEK